MGSGRDVVSVDGELLRQLSQRLAETRDRRLGIENTLQVLTAQREPLNRAQPAALRSPGAAGPEALSVSLPLGGSPMMGEEALRNLALRGVSDQGLQELNNLRSELRQADARQRELAQFFGAQHPQRKALIEQVSFLQEQIQQREQNAGTMLGHELTVARLNEKQLTEDYATERSRVKDLDIYLARDQQLLQNIRLVETLHDAVATKVNELDLNNRAIATGRPSIVVRILEGPEATVEQIWPKKVPILFVCGVLGIVAGGLWVSFRPGKNTLPAAR